MDAAVYSVAATRRVYMMSSQGLLWTAHWLRRCSWWHQLIRHVPEVSSPEKAAGYAGPDAHGRVRGEARDAPDLMGCLCSRCLGDTMSCPNTAHSFDKPAY